MHSEGQCEPHVCGDIVDRVPASVKEALASKRHAWATKLQARSETLSGEAKAKCVANCNNLFLDAACKLLADVSFSRDDEAFCYRCQSMQRLHPPARDNKIFINISGSTCVAWSAMAQSSPAELGWLHRSADPCLIWLFEQAAVMNHFIIHECVRGFDNAIFHKILGDSWHVCTVRFSAKQTGVPVDRTRAYTVACSKPMLCRLPFSLELVKQVLFHDNVLDCSIFLQADEWATMTHRQMLCPASLRHLALLKRYPTRSLVPAGDAYRLKEWEAAIEDKAAGLEDMEMKRKVRRHFVNVSQGAGYMSLPKDVVVPALLRGSKLYSLEADRWLHPSELLAIQGVPMFLDAEHSFSNLSPFHRVEVPLRTMTRMAGNSMHVAVVGGVLLLTLASYTEPEEESK